MRCEVTVDFQLGHFVYIQFLLWPGGIDRPLLFQGIGTSVHIGQSKGSMKVDSKPVAMFEMEQIVEDEDTWHVLSVNQVLTR